MYSIYVKIVVLPWTRLYEPIQCQFRASRDMRSQRNAVRHAQIPIMFDNDHKTSSYIRFYLFDYESMDILGHLDVDS